MQVYQQSLQVNTSLCLQSPVLSLVSLTLQQYMQDSSSHCWSLAVSTGPQQSLLVACSHQCIQYSDLFSSRYLGLSVGRLQSLVVSDLLSSNLCQSLAVVSTRVYQSVMVTCMQALVIPISLSWSFAVNASLQQSLLVSSSLQQSLLVACSHQQYPLFLFGLQQSMLVQQYLLVYSSLCWSIAVIIGRLQYPLVLFGLQQYLLVYQQSMQVNSSLC